MKWFRCVIADCGVLFFRRPLGPMRDMFCADCLRRFWHDPE